jgi:hypothetical protein
MDQLLIPITSLTVHEPEPHFFMDDRGLDTERATHEGMRPLKGGTWRRETGIGVGQRPGPGPRYHS